MRHLPAGVKLAAVTALAYGLGAAVLMALMLASWWRGMPITAPAQLLEPGLPFLVPGESLAVLPDGPAVPVTPAIVRAVATANIAVFGVASGLWLATAVGLWHGRRGARLLAWILFGALAAVGLCNLLVELVLVIMAGSLEAAGGAAVVLATAAATLGGMTIIPLLALLLLARPASVAAFAAAGVGRSPLVLALVVHFLLVAVLLLPAALAPAGMLAPSVLLGPWPLAGLPARLVLLLMAILHGLCGWGWWRGVLWSAPLSFWLNLFLAVSAMASAVLAEAATLATLGAGVLAPILVRVALVVVAVLAASLLPAVRRAARSLPHPEV